MSALPDGRIAYRLKSPWRKDQTHRVMTPLELVARLAALIPPPRHPLIHFHGVFAPHSAWRSSVVPVLASPCSDERTARCHELIPRRRSVESIAPSRCTASEPSTAPHPSATPAVAPGKSCDVHRRTSAESGAANTGVASPGGARKRWWIDWATLLRRVYDIDALACPCGGRLRFVEVVDDTEAAAIALRALGLPAVAPVIAAARARDPTPDFDTSPLDWGIDAGPAEQVDPPAADTW
jgi:hypothetical protein